MSERTRVGMRSVCYGRITLSRMWHGRYAAVYLL